MASASSISPHSNLAANFASSVSPGMGFRSYRRKYSSHFNPLKTSSTEQGNNCKPCPIDSSPVFLPIESENLNLEDTKKEIAASSSKRRLDTLNSNSNLGCPSPNDQIKRRKKSKSSIDSRVVISNSNSSTKMGSRIAKKKKSSRKMQSIMENVMREFRETHSRKTKHFKVHLPIHTKVSSKSVPVNIGVSETQGSRSYMEDRHSVVTQLYYNSMSLDGIIMNDSVKRTVFGSSNSTPSINAEQATLCAVYDGHNGSLAADLCVKRFHAILSEDKGLEDCQEQHHIDCDSAIRSLCKKETQSIENALHRSFLQVEKEILDETMSRGNNDGTTALVSLVKRDRLFIANVGDTRAVLGRKGNKAVRLSIDHKPDMDVEKNRIEESGGKVIFSGCWRVAHDQVPVRLAVSRSLGDHQLKSNLPNSCTAPLVSARPSVTSISLDPDDQFVILASDGIWDRISDDEAVEIVCKELADSASESREVAVKNAANRLIEIALQKKSFDNVTALVMAFDW